MNNSKIIRYTLLNFKIKYFDATTKSCQNFLSVRFVRSCFFENHIFLNFSHATLRQINNSPKYSPTELLAIFDGNSS